MARKSNTQRQVEKAVKKVHTTTIVLAVLFLIIGAVAGIAASWFITKNDKFELNGEKTVTLEIGAIYEDAGATVISFGKDISDKVKISGDITDFAEIDTSLDATYQIVYQVDDFRYKNYQLVRTVIVGNGGENNG